jgi:hypothetical protein
MAHSPLRRLAIETLEDRAVLSTVTGTVFNDADGNGVRSAGEAGIAGAVVFLDLTGDNVADAGEPAAVTAADGSYTFADAPTGTYAVRQVGTPAFAQTTANPNGILVTDGASLAGGDFGDRLTAGIGAFAAAGASPAAIQAAVDAFRAALGALNPNLAGVLNGGAGRREINWDGVPDNLSDPNALPADFFNTTSPRGVVYGFARGSAGTGFAVSATAANPTNSPAEFGTFDPTYPGQFQTFSPQRLFSPVGDNAYEINFFVAGSNTPATVSGFGAVFTGVDNTTASSIEYFDAAGNSLGKFSVPPAANGLSFLGVQFTDGRRVAKVRVTGGNTVIGGLDNGPVDDVAVQDDFIFGEPTAQVPPTVPPTVPPPPPQLVAVGAGQGGTVTLLDAAFQAKATLTAFDPSFTGGVRVAQADVNGDGVQDLIVGTGPGTATLIRVLDGKDRHELFSTTPFGAFTGGVFVAAGDIDGDGKAEVVVTPDEGGGPRVLVLHGGDFGVVADFFGIDDANFRGGARAAVGDVDQDGTGDLIVSAGFGGGPRVAVFDGASVAAGSPTRLFNDFFAFEDTLRNGTFVAAGDFDGDGFADLVTGAGPGGGPRVRVLSGKDLTANGAANPTALADFFAGDDTSRGGVRVAVRRLDGDARDDLVTGDGAGAGSIARGFVAADLLTNPTPPAFAQLDLAPGFTGGVFVG